MDTQVLNDIAHKVVSRTILAADESTGTIKKRLASVGIESTPETNRQYRQLLFTTPGIEQFVSGVILFDETIRQSTDDGVPFPILLEKKGIIPGIKVDKGTVKIVESGVDTITQGLEGLLERLKEYKKLGAKFAKWRAVFVIEGESPSDNAIERNAHDLAQYALMCQSVDIVPIIEPEVLMDGNNSIDQDKNITTKILESVFRQLTDSSINLQGIILKPNMITAAVKHSEQAPATTVAATTLQVLKQSVPESVPGVAFLSGGQSPDRATTHLNEINKMKNKNQSQYPWRITASYGRALQGETLEAWSGKKENTTTAQKIFLSRAEKVYKASLGQL